jgi:hypothetical protein
MSSTTYQNLAFDTQSADVILRASDGTHFRYFKAVLALASPFFRDLFSLPQATSQTPNNDVNEDSLLVIDVHESAIAVYSLLHFCYPAQRFEPQTFEEAEGLMTAGHRYCISPALDEGWKHVVRFVGKKEPLRAYCVACKLKLSAEARQAAKLVLALDHAGLLAYEPYLETLSAGDYQRLINYHQRACVAASEVANANVFRWVDYSKIYWDHAASSSCPQYKLEQEFQAARPGGDDRLVSKHVSLWWRVYMDAVGAALAQHPHASIPKSEKLMQLMRDGSSKCEKCRLDIGRAFLWNEFLSDFEDEIEQSLSTVMLDVMF